MKTISHQEFGGERPLYAEKDLRLEHVIIHAGESALKETALIEAQGCRFEGKYPLWCCKGFKVKDCLFTEGGRAALWYSEDLDMQDTLVEAPKMFREFRGARLRGVRFTHAAETFWSCSDIEIDSVQADQADYIFMHCNGIKVNNFTLNGNYSFQWSRNVEIRNSLLNTKDAFWETENVTVYDSEINGEYLGWHSRNLRLVRCHITGSQPLCYAEGLVLEDCTFGPDADLAFEYSSLEATIKGAVTSVKNPRSGSIVAGSIGEIIIDGNLKAPGNCEITCNVRAHLPG
ncbi:MAG: DUF3737 family protein [Bacteroidales bacterium]|nr:DUF3737 family protein [Bacteroidales bacterium]